MQAYPKAEVKFSRPQLFSFATPLEIEIRGYFRFHEEFGLAVDLINRRRVDLTPLLTEVLPVEDAVKAFDLASDRSRAMKVQIAF